MKKGSAKILIRNLREKAETKQCTIHSVVVAKRTLCEHAYGEKGCWMMDNNQNCTPYPKDSECWHYALQRFVYG